MGTDILRLQQELEKAKGSLKNVDENIKKLIGRDPSELPPPRPIKRPLPSLEEKIVIKTKSAIVNPALNRKMAGRLRVFAHENEEPPVKRRNVSVFKRLSEKVQVDDEDDDNAVPHHQKLISKVIVTNKEIPSREEALKAQNKDEKFKARNRRMFGALIGTLQKFQQEETKLKPKEEKRARLEKKIEECEIKEKEEVKRERQELFYNRRRKQAEIKVIELKMLRMKEYSAWEENQKPRRNFIVTKAKPHIHYLPKKLTKKTRELLANNRAEIDALIEKKKQQITDELKHIEERVKKNFEHKTASAAASAEGKNEKHKNVGENEEPNFASTDSEMTVETDNTKDTEIDQKVKVEIPSPIDSLENDDDKSALINKHSDGGEESMDHGNNESNTETTLTEDTCSEMKD